MPRPTLPPLPAASLLAKPHLFPRKLYPQSADPMARSMPGRQLIADLELADAFVQALDLQEGEVVIECFPGHGQVTRSLLNGGRPRAREAGSGRGGEWEAWEMWRRHLEEGEGNGEGEGSAGRQGMEADQGQGKGKDKEKAAYPAWTSAEMDNAVEVKGGKGAAKNADVPAKNGESSASSTSSSSPSSATTDRKYHIPPAVVAVEPSYTLLTRGLGPAEEMAALTAAPVAVPTPAPAPHSSSSSTALTTLAPPAQGSSIKTPVNQSIHHPNLVLSNSTAYAWHTLPDILSDPLVAPHIPRRAWSDVPPTATATAEAQEATFNADEVERIPVASQRDRAEAAHPPYTIVAHIPNSTGGEQMVSQWIGSAVGSADAEAEGSRQWIWRWGRARLAMVVPKNLYDRMMARPGEAANSRLSILTSALFHRSTLPPYHHVNNVDKLSLRTQDIRLGYSSSDRAVNRRLEAAARGEEPTPRASRAGTKQSVVGGRRRRVKTTLSEDAGEETQATIEAGTRSDSRSEAGEDVANVAKFTYNHHPSRYSSYLRPCPPPTPLREASFYPIASRQSPSLYLPDAPMLARPHFLGIQLVPRVHSPVTVEQKDAWDYVLRNCFVLQGKPLEEAIGLLGFAAEGLLDKVEEVQLQTQVSVSMGGQNAGAEGEKKKKQRKPWKGEAVSRSTLVKDLTVEQWARVVDVFDRWAFRPKNLLIDTGSSEEVHREIAVD